MNVGKLLQKFTLMLLLIGSAHSVLAAEISATVDRREIGLDETVRLVVRVSPQTNQAPDFSLLEKQFDILGRNQSSQYRNFNGRVEAFTEWQLVLAPRQAGTLLIPSFQFEDQFSDAIELKVSQANNDLDGSQPDIFLELTADLKTPYVQQQVLVNLTLYTAVPLRIEDAPELAVPGALVVPLNQAQFQKRVKDRVYSVSELRYAIFPQQSGTLEIPIQTFTVSAGGAGWSGYGRAQLKRLRSKPITLEVKPQASAFTGKTWLAASDVQLEDSLQGEQTWRTGEPVTRRIRIRVEGATAEQVPALSLPEQTGIKQYRETAEKSEQKNLNGVTAELVETVALVPTAPGEYTLPEVALSWWDTRTQQQREAVLPALSVTVEGALPAHQAPVTAPAISAPATDVAPAPAPLPSWLWALLAGLLVSNLITLRLWFNARRKPAVESVPREPAPAPTEATQWQALDRQAQAPISPHGVAQFLVALNTACRQHCGQDAQALAEQQPAVKTLWHRLAQLAWAAESQAVTNEDLQQLLQQIQALAKRRPTANAATTAPVPPLYPQ